MYLYQYSMKKAPFGQTPDMELFCATKTHIKALNVLLYSIKTGEAFCKILGKIGCGKILLGRLIIRQLEKYRRLAYIPNPNLTVKSLHYSLAKELGIKIRKNSRDDQITQSVQNRLVNVSLQQPVKFSLLAGWLVYYFSKGTQRLVNTLCHKALLLSYPKKRMMVSTKNVCKAAYDTDYVDRLLINHYRFIFGLLLLSVSSTALAFGGGHHERC